MTDLLSRTERNRVEAAKFSDLAKSALLIYKNVMTRNIPAPAAAATAIKVSSSMNSRHSIRDH
jgi:hypothetical protein